MQSWLRSPSSRDRRQTNVEGNKDMLWILYQPWLDLVFILVLELIWCSWRGQAVSTDKSLPDSQEAMGGFPVYSLFLDPWFLVCSTSCPSLCPTAMQPAPIVILSFFISYFQWGTCLSIIDGKGRGGRKGMKGKSYITWKLKETILLSSQGSSTVPVPSHGVPGLVTGWVISHSWQHNIITRNTLSF